MMQPSSPPVPSAPQSSASKSTSTSYVTTTMQSQPWSSKLVDFFADAEPGLFGMPGPILRLYQVGIGGLVASMFAWFAVSWTVNLGNSLLGLIFGGGGGTGGGGGSSWGSTDVSELLSLPMAFWALFIVAVFVALLAYTIALALSVPAIPHWAHHRAFARRLKPSPFVILGVLWLTNYFPTELIEKFYTPRLFVSYLCALGAVVYQLGYRTTCPSAIRAGFDQTSSLLRSKPVARYLLGALALTIVGALLWLTLLLVPNSFAHRPEAWWKVFLGK